MRDERTLSEKLSDDIDFATIPRPPEQDGVFKEKIGTQGYIYLCMLCEKFYNLNKVSHNLAGSFELFMEHDNPSKRFAVHEYIMDLPWITGRRANREFKFATMDGGVQWYSDELSNAIWFVIKNLDWASYYAEQYMLRNFKMVRNPDSKTAIFDHEIDEYMSEGLEFLS